VFTGLVAAMGSIRRLTRRGEDALLEIDTALEMGDVRIGDSIAVSGACLTVTALGGGGFTADVSAETLSRTTFEAAKPGDRVNLEKALRVGDPLGGHIVLGHVDGRGTIREKTVRSQSVIFGFEIDPRLSRYIVGKGSIAVDGISLTVNLVDAEGFGVTLIPHTIAATTLARKDAGARVNLEADLIGKYVEKFVTAGQGGGGGVTLDLLKEHGFA